MAAQKSGDGTWVIVGICLLGFVIARSCSVPQTQYPATPAQQPLRPQPAPAINIPNLFAQPQTQYGIDPNRVKCRTVQGFDGSIETVCDRGP